jgi:hypothetical protein
LNEAVDNLRRAQEKLGTYPDCEVSVNGEAFYLGTKKSKKTVKLACTLPKELLGRILKREVHWNDAELACLIRFHRSPNLYQPDVHTLLSFLHEPRPT